MAKIDILDPKWVDMVFANKNREYGAYQLRKGTSSRNLLALVILMTIALLIGGYLFYKVKAEKITTKWNQELNYLIKTFKYIYKSIKKENS